jgi:pimeloyl-ACP methyl ester carboxylesterase
MPSLKVNDQYLFYSESRDSLSKRPPLILIHGAGGQHSHWPPHLRRMADTTVYAPDLPGHGKSEGTGRHTVTAYAADMLALMDALELERAVVGGHSMGGAIALTMALSWPDRLAGLLLVGSGARLRVLPAILDGLQSEFESTVDMVVDYAYGPNSPENLVRLGRRTLLKCDPAVIHGDYSACNTFDVMDHLGEINVPTLVVVGTADQLTPPKYAGYMVESLPNAELALVEGGGHMVAVEMPQDVANIVDNWLGGLPAS